MKRYKVKSECRNISGFVNEGEKGKIVGTEGGSGPGKLL